MQVNNQPTNNDQFLKLPYNVLEATGFVGKGGEIVDITLQQKIIYCWMKQRCEFFARDKREYFDNVDDIANSVRINRKTVMGAIQLFKDNGVLIANKKPLGGAREKWVFKSFSELRLADTKTKESAPSKPPQQPQQTPEPQKAQPAPTMDDFVLAGAEWTSEAMPDDVYEDLQELEDDGSYADSFSYSDMSELPETVVVVQEAKPAAVARPGIESVDLTTLPEICYERNGSINDKVWDWLEDRGFYIEDAENCIVQLNGYRYVFKGRQFDLCNSAIEEEAFSPF